MDDRPPPSAPPHDASRRSLLRITVGGVALFGGLVLGVPLVGTLIGPAFRLKPTHWSQAGLVKDVPFGRPTVLSFPDLSTDAYLRTTVTHNVWAVRLSRSSPSDVTVYSPICPHLGCRYNWDPNAKHFECPCHGSVFALDGKVLGGPAPRPLDTLPTRIEHGRLSVEWERFEVGIKQKIRV